MPPKQKPKKGGLSDEQIKTTVRIVKQYWPDYPISVADIRNPTKEFILRFYRECVNNLDEKCAFVTRSNLIPYPPGLSEEDLLFLRLSKIPSLVNADFKLGDLYIFDPKRVNNHIFVTMHFLIFTETVMDKMVEICNNVFDTKEKIQSNQQELNEIKEEKTQKQINLSLGKSQNKKLKETAMQVAPEYEETLALIEESDQKYKDLVLKTDNLKEEVENLQEEIKKLEKTELHLKKQIVTEEEFKNLISALESLQKEEQALEEIDENNGLFEQKQYIETLQRCLQELNCLNLPEDLFNLSSLRVQLKNEQQNLEYATAVQQSSKTEIEQMKTKCEIQKHNIQKKNQNLQVALKKATENAVTEEAKLKKSCQQMFRINQNLIEELKQTIGKQEADLKRLKSELLNKYTSICQTLDMAVQQYNQFLNKVNKRLVKKADSK